MPLPTRWKTIFAMYEALSIIGSLQWGTLSRSTRDTHSRWGSSSHRSMSLTHHLTHIASHTSLSSALSPGLRQRAGPRVERQAGEVHGQDPAVAGRLSA